MWWRDSLSMARSISMIPFSSLNMCVNVYVYIRTCRVRSPPCIRTCTSTFIRTYTCMFTYTCIMDMYRVWKYIYFDVNVYMYMYVDGSHCSCVLCCTYILYEQQTTEVHLYFKFLHVMATYYMRTKIDNSSLMKSLFLERRYRFTFNASFLKSWSYICR